MDIWTILPFGYYEYAAINIHMQVLVNTCFQFFGCSPRTAEVYGNSIFSFLKNCQLVFHIKALTQ